MARLLTTLVFVLGLSATACGGDDDGAAPGTDAGPRPGVDAGDVPREDAGLPRYTDSGPGDGGEAPDGATDDGGTVVTTPGTCADPVPPGADAPDPLPTYAGTCPTLTAGRNTIRSGGADRELLLVVPDALDPAERLPVIFMWHWLGGDADGFLTRGEVQAAADRRRFLAVIPEEKGDLLTRWPYLVIDSAARVEEEARFFDDALACVAEQFAVNEHCVASAGVSAGALWTDQLAQIRSRRLSSILSLSGGVGRTGDILNPVRPWTGATHAMPALVLWGGPTDFCGVQFHQASMNLEAGLVAGGHYIIECIHNCAHSQPPLDPPPGESEFESLWSFALDHPFWLADGASPYQTGGLPTSLPTWCAPGAGMATIRSGMCEGGVLGSCM